MSHNNLPLYPYLTDSMRMTLKIIYRQWPPSSPIGHNENNLLEHLWAWKTTRHSCFTRLDLSWRAWSVIFTRNKIAYKNQTLNRFAWLYRCWQWGKGGQTYTHVKRKCWRITYNFSKFHTHVSINIPKERQWLVTGIYSHLEAARLEETWQLLRSLRSAKDVP